MKGNLRGWFCAALCVALCVVGVASSASVNVPERSEIPEKYRWNLEAIYPTFEAWDKSLEEISPRIDALSAYAGHLGEDDGAKLLAFLKEDEAVSREFDKLYIYANLKSDEDMRVTRPMEMAGKAESLLVRYDAATAFFNPELMSLPEDELRKWIARPELKLYDFFMEQKLRVREHTLSKVEEELMARVGDLSSVPEKAFSLLTNADLKFPNIKDENGNDIELTEERWYKLCLSPNREVRKAAFLGIHETFGKFINALSALYFGSVKGDVFYSRARKYKNSLEMALFDENVPASVYENVVGTAERFAPLMHRLVSLKKKALNLDEFRYYDLYVPMSAEPLKNIPYEKACEMAIEALAPLGEDYVANFKRGLAERWIDVYENQGKRGGAYSWSAYDTHPYVLMNYNGTLDDVFTLVHEMGHSLHSHYSHTNQPHVYAGYTILLAEVASTTNEVLLLGYLLKNARTEDERKWLLDYYYNMVRTVFYRQAMFADFERRAHTYVEKGNVLTPEWLGGLWKELNATYYGPEFVIDDALCAEWARIPHFYTPFYVYKYVTGFTVANAFASAILNGEEGAVDRYLTFLKSGGSDWPLNILKRAGIDLTSVEPFERMMKLFEDRLDEGEKLWCGEKENSKISQDSK